MKNEKGINQTTMVILLIMVFIAMILAIWISQFLVEQNALTEVALPDVSTLKEQREIDKLAAEIRQIRSDTAGSLFWLKLIAVFVTVGGAVSGYLVGQSRATRARIEFDDRKNVDAAYQAIVQELSAKEPILRAAAAVKLGTILKDFPDVWNVSDVRQDQIIRLTKDVLAAALAIESDPKVLKLITIALVQHQPWRDDPDTVDKKRYGDLRNIDLSSAKAIDAYWAKVDFTYADLYLADLTRTSLRSAILNRTQLRETNLINSVLIDADCRNANFKLADLRGADLTGAILTGANLEEARVYGASIENAQFGDNPDTEVDLSQGGDGSELIPLNKWINDHHQ